MLYPHLPSPFSRSQGLAGGSAGGAWGGRGAGSRGGRASGAPPPLPALPGAGSGTPAPLARAVFVPSRISAPPAGHVQDSAAPSCLQEKGGVSEVGGLGAAGALLWGWAGRA